LFWLRLFRIERALFVKVFCFFFLPVLLSEASRMRILYSHRVQSHDGQGVHIEELVRAFRNAGHDVLVVGPSFYNPTGFGGENRGIAAVRRLLPGVLGEVAELAYNISAYARLKRAWRRFRPDFVYERCNLYFLAGSRLARRHGVELFLEVNSPLADERAKHGGLKLAGLARKLERWTWQSATRVLPVTHVLAGILVANGVDPTRIGVIPNGIDLSRYPPRPATQDGGPITLGFTGFVRDWHRLDTVIEGLARRTLDHAVGFTIIGDGPAIPSLTTLARELGVSDRVKFAGLVLPAEVPALTSTFTIALQPSATPYASPLKIFDYMAAGCAIVAPDQPNICEILTHEQTALLFDPEIPGAMWQAVERLINDAALRGRLGGAARAELERQNYTWAGNAQRVVACADRLKEGLLS
jgi:glycosyltransferase involved in cell wall biosynthesis